MDRLNDKKGWVNGVDLMHIKESATNCIAYKNLSSWNSTQMECCIELDAER